ncbi:MAG: extracellular solute-binding protein [Alphaproteobacteria bacterium]
MTSLRLPAVLALAAAAAATGIPAALSQEDVSDQAKAVAEGEVYEGHAFAMHGDIKYGADFTHFDYVNPDAPKGGQIRIGARGTFDTLNPVIIQGTLAGGLLFTLDSLMVSSADEPFTEYCLVCETVRVPPDRGWVEFDLHPDATFSDGSPITPEDVIWSFEAWTEHNPQQRFYYADVSEARQVGERTVRFDFSTNENPELPLIMGQILIMSKAYWTAEGRDISRPTLTPWVGSGAYTIGRVDPGQRIAYVRNPDYWAAEHPVYKGQLNFDRVVFEYYGDEEVMFEAFRGGELDYRVENSSKNWATGYDIPEAHAGVLVREELEDGQAQPFQGLFFNLRRAQFEDRRVREALILAFDFEWTNQNLFYSLYERTGSFFESSELEATGEPGPEELAVLEPFRDQLPAEVFGPAYEPPSTAVEGGLRANLRRAVELLEEAGYRMQGGVRTHEETGVRLQMEILLNSPTFERIMLPYAANLERLGVRATVRTVDASQYVERLDNFDFDATVDVIAQSLSPGNEQRAYWGTEAADMAGSQNVMGLQDPAIDALILQVIRAPDREALVTRTRALDRALTWQMFALPQWHNPYSWIAYWDKYDHPRPEDPPARGVPFIAWWFDAEKAATLAERRQAAR